MPKMNNRCAPPSTATVLHSRMEGTTNADTPQAIAPNTMAAPSKRRPRSGAATTVKHTPNTMIAHAAIMSPTIALADDVPTTPSFSNSARPAEVNGRSASPCRSPSPITAPMVAAAATAPTRIPAVIRESLIAPKGNGPDRVPQGDDVSHLPPVKFGDRATKWLRLSKECLAGAPLNRNFFTSWQLPSVQQRLYSSSRTGAKCSTSSSAHFPTTGTRS